MPEPSSAVSAVDSSPLQHQLCESGALQERGLAHVFDVLVWRQPARAFAMRFDGRVVAYVNRCAHVPVELDWQPGQFLDIDRRWILCTMHGAAYEPANGRCVGGPCGQGKLMPITTREEDGLVYWYPSPDIQAVACDGPKTIESRP
ncbi:MAG: Rieske 2Fe-2S domain-containing protein [Ideonella sp.]|jgi:nitrite reductase/ring-hydroxylating ferredoxin subunit|nr:Rieske 2Fe-2S domain-containing protein [Ideonella sp.]